MSVICPKDKRFCPDDLCNSGGTCIRTGEQPLEKCEHCHRVYAPGVDGDIFGSCDDCLAEIEENEIELT